MKRTVCPGCGMTTWRDGGCALPGCENYGEKCTTCPCFEDYPNLCSCPCVGCKFNCGACWCESCRPEGISA